MIYIFLTVFLFASGTAKPQGRHEDGQPRQLSYPTPYGLDLQYDFSLLDPQLQYPGYGAQPRLQPQVFLYPGGAPGQPFLLQPAGPGNFLVPQPQPGFVLRDAPQPNPLFVQGQPKPYVPPINKDAEEIPTGPSLTSQGVQAGRKPEKLETFEDSPELSSGEAEILASADRNQALKPGQRFFILNGQPLFSNYPLPQFANTPYQPTPERYGDEFYYKHAGPSFPQGSYVKPTGGDFHQKESTKSSRPSFDVRLNELDIPQGLFDFNQKEDPQPNPFGGKIPLFKLRPIEVPDEETSTSSEEIGFGKDVGRFESKKEGLSPKSSDQSRKETGKEESISQAEPGAIALAGPGGVASAAPRGTALSGQKGLSISSPKATAIAGPAKEKDTKPVKNKKEKQ